MLNWVAFDLTGVVLPYLLVYWVMRGDLLAKVPGLGLPIESAVLGLMMVTATVVLPFWIWLAKRVGKRRAFMAALAFWIVLMLLIPLVPQGATTLTLALAVAIGISVSAAHVLPDAIFPDVIEWSELKTGRRHEGIYYGAKNFVRKLTTAIAIFVVLQVLGWFGYQPPPKGATSFVQPASALNAIRFLIGPVGALLLIATLIVTWFYPLDRDKFNRVRRLLEHKKGRRAARAAASPEP